MRIAVCDDSKREQKQFLDSFHELNVVDEPECFSDGASFLEAARKQPPFDLAFLDIYMPNDNGLDIAKKLQRISPETGIVFVTSSREHAVDAFSLHVLHYLVKPITVQGIGEAIRRYKLRPVKKRPTITLVSGRENHTVYLDEIIYIQSDRHAKEVYLTEGRLIKIWTPLNELEEKLDASFLKLGRSTIVNMEQIEQMGTDSCILRDGTRLEFTRRERGSIREAYDNYLFTRLSERQGV